MTSLNISLPEPLKAYIESKVEAGDYGTPSEYVRDLIRRDKQTGVVRLEAELLAAIRSGDIDLSGEDLSGRSVVSVLRDKLAGRKRKRS